MPSVRELPGALKELLLNDLVVVSHRNSFPDRIFVPRDLVPLPRRAVQSVLDELGFEEEARVKVEKQLRFVLVTEQLLSQQDDPYDADPVAGVSLLSEVGRLAAT